MGDTAVVVRLGDHIDPDTLRSVRALAHLLDRRGVPGMLEYVPAFTTITVYYDLLGSSLEEICGALERLAAKAAAGEEPPQPLVTIPVCYGGVYGEDLEWVARHAGMTAEDVIEVHAGAEYVVGMMGFAPGFPYLAGLPERIAAPRRASPRVRVPAGSVGIAGSQTGIYPLETPGGWQLIGRTPLTLFRPWENPPTLLRAGHQVRFQPIGEEQYRAQCEEAP
jgi:inhibitor of KinA